MDAQLSMYNAVDLAYIRAKNRSTSPESPASCTSNCNIPRLNPEVLAPLKVENDPDNRIIMPGLDKVVSPAGIARRRRSSPGPKPLPAAARLLRRQRDWGYPLVHLHVIVAVVSCMLCAHFACTDPEIAGVPPNWHPCAITWHGLPRV